MKITEFEIQNFRNIPSLKMNPNSSLTAFWGANGQGKTNLLEALYACLRGKSFRHYSKKTDWIPELSTTFPLRISVKLEDSKTYPLECELRKDVDGKWITLLNSKRATAATLAERVAVVVFSPDDHSMIRGGPEARRHFVDNLWTDICPGYGEILSRYEKSLKSRNELLKIEDLQVNHQEFRVWTELLASAGAELNVLRRELWPQFEGRFLRISHELFEGAENVRGLELRPQVQLSNAYDKEALMKAMMEGFEKDRATGWTHVGPHRDDFTIQMEKGGDSRSRASQGQARLYALALRWTHAEWIREERGEAPIFLFDDFSSELDAQRRERLLTFVRRQSGQLFMTGTERSLVDSGPFSDYTYFVVKTGIFTQIS